MSGFFFKNGDSFFIFLKKKFVKYILPYFVFSCFLLFTNIIKYNYSFTEFLSQCKLILFGVRNTLQAGGAWFLPCLFVINIIYYVLNKVTNKKITLFSLSLFLYMAAIYILPSNPAISPSWFWNADSALFYILYFCLGNILFDVIKKIKKNKFSKIISCFIIFLTLILFFYGRSFLGIFATGKMYFLSDILITLILIFFNCITAFLMEDVCLLKNIGKDTMYLCLTEVLVKNIIVDLLSILKLTIVLENPLMTVIYSFFVIYVNHKYLIPIFKKVYIFILRKCEVLFNEISFN